MSITSNQDIPEKPKVNEPWTFKRLFPLANMASSLTKSFTSPLDILLGYLVFILGIAELLGREVSWFLYIFSVLMLVANIFERHKGILTDNKISKEDGK